ncbi:MAG: GIY-YIG nuclease family protein [Synergistaceae bacterium]|nr:GIY-YIG nuclease family protein [Synergistaceae bacterium]
MTAGTEKHFFVYLLRCSDRTLYCGWTTDLQKRLNAHNSGTGAKYTRARRPVELVYYEESENKNSAMKREYEIKHLSRAEKLRLINRAF